MICTHAASHQVFSGHDLWHRLSALTCWFRIGEAGVDPPAHRVVASWSFCAARPPQPAKGVQELIKDFQSETLEVFIALPSLFHTHECPTSIWRGGALGRWAKKKRWRTRTFVSRSSFKSGTNYNTSLIIFFSILSFFSFTVRNNETLVFQSRFVCINRTQHVSVQEMQFAD